MNVNMFWCYGEFSVLEYICAKSFLTNGFELTIWTYGNSSFIDSAYVRDAREILDESTVFKNKRDSYASFSDYFRYALLSKNPGGLYVDTDVFCLTHPYNIPKQPFLVTQRTINGGLEINNNVIYNPNPDELSLINTSRLISANFNKSEIVWDELGPKLLTKLVEENPLHGFTIYPPNFANPINYWQNHTDFFNFSYEKYVVKPLFLHLYSFMWQVKSIDKNSKEILEMFDSLIFQANSH